MEGAQARCGSTDPNIEGDVRGCRAWYAAIVVRIEGDGYVSTVNLRKGGTEKQSPPSKSDEHSDKRTKGQLDWKEVEGQRDVRRRKGPY